MRGYSRLLAVALLVAAAAPSHRSPRAEQEARPEATQPEETRPEEDPHRRRSTLYVSSTGTSEVVALSRDSGEIIARIPVAPRPMGLAARADGDRIYVACASGHAVQVIDGATRSVLDTIALQNGAAPSDLVLSQDERTLFVAATGLDAIYVLDAASLQQTAEIPVGRRPTRLALSPDGRRLYALSTGSGRVDIVDTVSRSVVASPLVGAKPDDMAVDPRLGSIYVVRGGAPALHRVEDGAAQAREISIEAPAEAVAVDPGSGRLFLASPATGRVLLLAPSTGASAKTIPVAEVTRLVVDPEGRFLYALSSRRGVLTWVNRILGTVEKEVPVGKEPWDVVLIP